LSIVYALKTSGVDCITAASMTYPNEAAGISSVCSKINIPYLISFIIENNSKLPNGDTLETAIEKVDEHIKTNNLTPPLMYGVNCAYPTYIGKAMTEKIRGKLLFARGNPSKLCLEERDNLT